MNSRPFANKLVIVRVQRSCQLGYVPDRKHMVFSLLSFSFRPPLLYLFIVQCKSVRFYAIQLIQLSPPTLFDYDSCLPNTVILAKGRL